MSCCSRVPVPGACGPHATVRGGGPLRDDGAPIAARSVASAATAAGAICLGDAAAAAMAVKAGGASATDSGCTKAQDP